MIICNLIKNRQRTITRMYSSPQLYRTFEHLSVDCSGFTTHNLIVVHPDCSHQRQPFSVEKRPHCMLANELVDTVDLAIKAANISVRT